MSTKCASLTLTEATLHGFIPSLIYEIKEYGLSSIKRRFDDADIELSEGIDPNQFIVII
jgi:hypothetical protein